MREKKEFTVLAFSTNAAAMEMERYCLANAIPGRLIPLPEEVSAGCGVAWRMEPGDWEKHRDQIEGAGLSFAGATLVRQWVFSRND